jgi:hypothetical protein
MQEASDPSYESSLPPELAELASLENETAIEDGLRVIAGRYGNPVQTWKLPDMIKADKGMSVYLIEFETISQAVSASRSLGFPMAGLTVVMVSLPRVAQFERPQTVCRTQASTCYLLTGAYK